MRELLRLVLDRLNESGALVLGEKDRQDPEKKVYELRRQISEVLDDGLFDGRMTDIDMRQLPPAL